MEVFDTFIPMEIVVVGGVLLFILVLWRVTSVQGIVRKKKNRLEPHKHRPDEVYERKQEEPNIERVDHPTFSKNELKDARGMFIQLLKVMITGMKKK